MLNTPRTYSALKNITPCITSYKRTDKLRRAVESCMKAGFPRIVVCASGVPPEEEHTYWNVFNEFVDQGLEVLFHPTDSDRGCNELWLRCAYHSPTEYMIVLHDDDYFHPSLGKELMDHGAIPLLDSGVGLVSWRGNARKDDGTERACIYHKGPTKQMGIAVLAAFIMKQGEGSLSPVVSILRRSTLIPALKEAEDFFDSSVKCWHHSGMPYGTEIIAYQRHCEAYSRWFYIDKPLSYFGDWEGSGTMDALKRGTIDKVVYGYDLARDYCRKHRGVGYKPRARILYVWDTFKPSNIEDRLRYDYAAAARNALFNMQRVIPLPVISEDLRRSAAELGDASIPYVKDLMMIGGSVARPEDIVIVANSDVGPVITLEERMREIFTTGVSPRAVVLKRRDFEDGKWPKVPFCDIRNGKNDNGVDAVAFNRSWLEQYLHLFPDMLMGREGWDSVMRVLVAETQPGMPVEIEGLLAHARHEPSWRQGTQRHSLPGQKHNIRLAKGFYSVRNGRYSHVSGIDREDQPMSDFGVRAINRLIETR